MRSMNAHIAFPGNAREALTFYQAVFGGEVHFHTVGDRQHDGLPEDAIFHAELQGVGFLMMAADTPENLDSLVQSPRISLHVSCTCKAELEQYFSGLSEGGSVHCEVGPAFGSLFAMVTDRYGVSWYLTSPS